VSPRAGLQLVLFLGLVGLGMLVVEKLPAPAMRHGAPAAATERPPAAPPPAPVAVLDSDVLVLRLGGPAQVAAKPATQQVPAPPAPAAPSKPSGLPAIPDRDTYVVQPGDTLSDIARRELGSAQLADQLARLNKLANPGAIRAGQVLRLR
jgi:nucleoid-associated protein YgaU